MKVRRQLESGVTVYDYDAVPGELPVKVVRLGPEALDEPPDPGHAHAHDFLVLAYFEQGRGTMHLGSREMEIASGDVYLIAPGEVVGVGDDPLALVRAEGWSVAFTAEALGSEQGAFLRWRAHPLLLPFVLGNHGIQSRLRVTGDDRSAWSQRFAAMAQELDERRDGYQEALLAHLTLLLVEVSRLAHDIVADLRLNDEPLLAQVFGVIEDRYPEPLSLRDVAHAVSLTPGYLTTSVREKTGRTVQEWIVERRMSQARRLLAATDQSVEEVARSVGYADPGYFIRSFRRAHGITPRAWRVAGRPAAG